MATAELASPPVTDERLRVVNPATEELLEEIACTTRSEFDAAVERSQVAQREWRRDLDRRREALRQGAARLRKRAASFDLANLLTKEQGKPKREAMNEVYAASHWLATLADLELPEPRQQTTATGAATIYHEPIGVVGAITAWNFPVFLAACKIASALLAGNALLLKPSPYTPLATRRMVDLLNDGDSLLPDGVLAVLTGDREVGNWLVESPVVGHVSFTGSVGVGKQILEASAAAVKPVTLELGGNDAAIVMSDVEVEEIASPLFWGAFTNAGQFCTGIKRVYAQAAIYDRLLAALGDMANATVVGNGLQPKTQMGPLTHQAQHDRVAALVDDAVSGGATAVAGGSSLGGPGYFYPPTILANAAPEADVVCDEQFGPVVPVIPFDDPADAIRQANDSDFGLGGSIWTSDPGRGEELAVQLECGTAWINQHGALDPLVPFAGAKESGIGSENGIEGVREFTQVKVVHRMQER